MRIVPIALKDYFLYDIPIKQTIENHKDIFDFCMRLKINSSTTAYWKGFVNNELKEIKLDRTTRYYVSNRGGILLKHFNSGSTSGVNVGFNTTLFNTYVEKDNYDINYRFYISEANKVKNAVVDRQLYLFDI